MKETKHIPPNMVTSQSAKSEASEDFASDLTEEDLQMERFDLVDDLRNWIVDPKANKTSEANKTPVIGDLEGIIKLEARFQKQGNEEQDTVRIPNYSYASLSETTYALWKVVLTGWICAYDKGFETGSVRNQMDHQRDI